MKKINLKQLDFVKAFTYIELLVVVTIITLISTTGVFYFLDFVKEQEISQKLYIIEQDLQDLDKQVKKYEIFDYEIQFNTSNTGSKFYINNTNIFDTVTQNITILNQYGSGIISSVGVGTGMINIYENDKLNIKIEHDWTTNYSYSFNKFKNYKISATSSGEILNDIILNYYSEDNLYPEKNNNLELIKISETKGGIDLLNIIIKNIGGKKTFTNGGTEYNKIYLYFENNGLEDYILLEK